MVRGRPESQALHAAISDPGFLLGETSPCCGIEREIPRLPVGHDGTIAMGLRGSGEPGDAGHRDHAVGIPVRIAIDIDSTLHHHWPLVAAAAKRRFGVELPYEEHRVIGGQGSPTNNVHGPLVQLPADPKDAPKTIPISGTSFDGSLVALTPAGTSALRAAHA